MTTDKDALLLATIQVAVPLRFGELAALPPWLRAAKIQEWAAAAVEPIASHGDTLMFGGEKGAAADVFNHLARGLAALAHSPGGVRFAGLYFDATEGGAA